MNADRQTLLHRYQRIRAQTEALCAPLEPEDHVVQTMPDVSPPKWHLAHTTWFFEVVILQRYEVGFAPFQPKWGILFNSYYVGLGERWERARRGVLSRPLTAEVMAWRANVDARIARCIEGMDEAGLALLALGLAHEEQHQELLVTDIKHILATNPLRPTIPIKPRPQGAAPTLTWQAIAGGVHRIGTDAPTFAFDNERPRHRILVEDFSMANRCVTNREWLAFIEAGGYQRPELWLSEGWDAVQTQGWGAPGYWRETPEGWTMVTLGGQVPVNPDEPVCHVSFFEAEAYARFVGARLPTEAEWEVAQREFEQGELHDLSSGMLQPHVETQPAFLGNVWEWTSSAYRPYPGFQPFQGVASEYNGKFMSSQFVLRGGSAATPPGHIRPTYRNFFHPDRRWQYTGVRLAK